MVSTPDRPDEAFDLAVDRSQRLFGAPGGEQKASARSERRFLIGLAAGSLLLHGLILLALLSLERAPDEIQASREIPVEVMVEPPPTKSAAPQTQATEKPSEPPPASAASEKPKAEQRPLTESKAEPQEKPAAELKPAEPPAKPAAAKTAPRQAPAAAAAKDAGEKSGSADKHAATAASSGAASSKGGGGNQPAAPAALSLPYDLGPPIFRAVAVPLPVEGGDEPMNYKVIVFGLLERAKHYPEAAIARGARGAAVIGFTVDEAGQVTSVALLQSSGEVDLDEESVALVHRAAPFPAPPAGAQRSFAAQVNFGMGQ